jgi:coenzyme F420-reducing hydrogenase delta subunit
VEYTRKLLENIGLQGRRIQMINVSAAMGAQFAWSAAEFTEEIRQLGPNPLKEAARQADIRLPAEEIED